MKVFYYFNFSSYQIFYLTKIQSREPINKKEYENMENGTYIIKENILFVLKELFGCLNSFFIQ